jgi:phosphohistidine phosphatase SixA
MRPLQRVIALAGLVLALIATSAPFAEEPQKGLSPELLAELRTGGLNIFFRHGRTPNYSDPDDTNLDNCATQRNLSKEGIDQSVAIGEAIRELEIPIGIVRASPYCRCVDTAWHAFGRVERDRALRLSGKEPDQDAGEVKAWRHLRNMGEILPMPGTNSFFVSHGTVGEVFGTGYLDEGEAVVVRPDGKGGWRPVARIKSDEWRPL